MAGLNVTRKFGIPTVVLCCLMAVADPTYAHLFGPLLLGNGPECRKASFQVYGFGQGD